MEKNKQKIIVYECTILMANLLKDTFMTKEDSETIFSLINQINDIYKKYDKGDILDVKK